MWCLSGQQCIVSSRDILPIAGPLAAAAEPPRDDGRCGQDFNGATCNPEGEYGRCCSQYGFCGKTSAHCLSSQGCQSGCQDAPTETTSETPTGTSDTEPVLGSPDQTTSPEDGPETMDGSCGADNGGVVCGTWFLGSCCSMYGFCGNTTAHCGEGCQSGPCLGGAVEPAPGPQPAPPHPNPGTFEVTGDCGVPVMHVGLLPNGRLVFLDKVENFTKLKLPNGQYAYSSEYDPITKENIPLAYATNSFCAGGTFLADGTFLAVGGNGPLEDVDPTVTNGFDGIRYLRRSFDDASLNGQDWAEPGNKLASSRWYPSVQTMPDGSILVVSGSLNGLDPSVTANNNPTYEILNPQGISTGINVPMEILELNQPYYMYPFLHLLRDGSIFIFTSKSSQLFSVPTNTILRALPDLPGGYRTYPNTGSSILLPLSKSSNYDPDIVICGGGAYQDITSPTDASCGRIRPLAPIPHWEMDSMPEGRGMVEAVLLPDGTVLWLNGAERGAQGYELAADPALTALLYDPDQPLGQRWSTAGTSTIPRLYHSVAILLLDGTVLVAGSNPVEQPVLTPTPEMPFVTEFRLEVYTPPYLSGPNADRRPTDIFLSTRSIGISEVFEISFTAPLGAKVARVALYYGGFVTHSLHMGQRSVVLELDDESADEGFVEEVRVREGVNVVRVLAPPSTEIAPPGPYVVFVLVDGVPGFGEGVVVL
ncbi:carbohydrate-binding module family 18 [Patellaria atrata CBS 101060]|uniref:Carbohydrate-binding module family 18 n=1 Tax=Patellaria atrata CBS 101060 TaxID=1346257 RepID=A0A9P4SAS7_9PEZI|nr:carbohydrate-binding module family 18 [Patellaria atrata CBS 101060]